MERRENQFQPLDICQRLFNFIANSVKARGLKRVTLGSPKGHGLVQVPITGTSTIGADATMQGHMGDATKPVEGVGEPLHTHGMPKEEVASTFKVEFEQASGSDRSIAIGGGSLTQLQKGGLQRTISVEERESKYKAQFNGIKIQQVQEVGVSKAESSTSEKQVKIGSQGFLQPVKIEKNGSAEVTPPVTTEYRANVPKSVSFKDVEVRGRANGKEKEKEKILSKGKMTLVIEPETLKTTSNSDVNENASIFIQNKKKNLSLA